ncbi:MAG: ABC transporter ATP-binding protein [Prevotellaceae bacterium]|jgi:ABC-2 type transport system ATP-binding protein|nr:ABC transporter ATP-binding protein [Prevotellaceae bacterium]
MAENIVSIQGLTKDYGPLRALDGVSLDIPERSIFGILGPNGSGKTTLLSILMDILYPKSGSISIMGQPSSYELRKKIGCLLETPSFYSYLSAEDNLRIAAKIKDVDEADIPRVLKRLGLYERRASKFSAFSLGMKQRLALASALLGNPSLVVFDEPTNGLDPQGIVEVRGLIRELWSEGKTVIIASHLLDEVEKVCTHVAILKKGKLLATGSVEEVLGEGLTFKFSAGIKNEELRSILAKLNDIKSITQQGDLLIVNAYGQLTAEELNKLCFENGIVLSHLEMSRKKLESWFVEVTQNT